MEQYFSLREKKNSFGVEQHKTEYAVVREPVVHKTGVVVLLVALIASHLVGFTHTFPGPWSTTTLVVLSWYTKQ
jgi:hypothetical protein